MPSQMTKAHEKSLTVREKGQQASNLLMCILGESKHTHQLTSIHYLGLTGKKDWLMCSSEIPDGTGHHGHHSAQCQQLLSSVTQHILQECGMWPPPPLLGYAMWVCEKNIISYSHTHVLCVDVNATHRLHNPMNVCHLLLDICPFASVL